MKANVKFFLRKPNQPFLLTTNRKDVAEALYESQQKGKANICLINNSPEGRYFYKEAHFRPRDSSAARTVFDTSTSRTRPSRLSPAERHFSPGKKRKVIDEAIAKQTHVTVEQRNQLRAALYRQHQAVAESKCDMGKMDTVPHVLRPKTEEHAYVKQFPIPAAHLTFIYQQVDKLLRLGAIQEEYSSLHNSPVLAVKKPHLNELRFAIDLRKVNECMYNNYHSFMDILQCLHRLGGLGTNFMSALDLINTYWQLALHEYSHFQCQGGENLSGQSPPWGSKVPPQLSAA